MLATMQTPEEIRALRRAIGLSQERFAHRVGVTVAAVNRWERGHAKPSPLAQQAMQSLIVEVRRDGAIPEDRPSNLERRTDR
jgi:putative transcriptional regulator